MADDPRTQLALETIGKSASMALFRGDECMRSVQIGDDQKVRPAASLSPQLDELLRWASTNLGGVDFVSVAVGPGSFTGLRVAVTTAKTLGYALKLPLVAVDSLVAYAASCSFADDASELLVGLNAYRQQVFVGEFVSDPLAEAAWIDQTSVILDQHAWLDRLSNVSKATQFSGDESVFRGHISPKQMASRFTRPSVCVAHGVGVIGLAMAQRGRFTDPMSLAPNYLKPSAAEEKSSES